MTATLAPEDEACTALVDRINTGTDYALAIDAKYTRVLVDPLEEIESLRVDVVHDTAGGERERLDGLDESRHTIRVWIRDNLEGETPEAWQQAALLRTQLLARLDNWDSSDRRVRVWNAENEELEQPVKEMARKLGLFIASIVLDVRVEP